MRIPSSTCQPSAGANMTPMIDVVFLLIIFFLVSSHLARQENHFPLDLPWATTFDAFDPDQAPLTISVDSQAQLRVGGNIIDRSALKPILVDWVAAASTNRAIRIRTDGNVQYQYIEPVLREAALAGVTDAAIAVREELDR